MTSDSQPGAELDGGKTRVLSRDDILGRYRRWRQLRTDIQTAALNNVSRSAFVAHAKRIGLSDGKVLVVKSEPEVTLAYDLAIYSARAGTTRAIDRCARLRSKSQDADEALVLKALCASRFSVFRVIGRHEPAGLLIEDLMRGGELWLLDEGLEQCMQPGALLATRVAPIEGFVVTCGAVIPIDREAAGEIEAFLAGSEDDEALADVADDRRFVDYIYKMAIECELMNEVEYR
jgi:hypothetical protein